MTRYLFLLLSGISLFSVSARADCFNPAAPAGDVIFNKDYCVMQFCNGLDWIPTGKSDPTACNSTCSPPGLVAHWKFDESSGAGTAVDNAGGNNGTLINMDPATDWVAGKVGNALDFDGMNDSVDISNVDLSAIAPNAGTVCAWIKPARAHNSSQIDWIINRHSSGDIEFQMGHYYNNSLYFGFIGPGRYITSATATTWPQNQWAFYCTTWGGSAVKGYINSTQLGSAAFYGPISSSTRLRIGSQQGASFFQGSIDDIRLYNRALTAGEVSALYNGGAGCL